MENKTFTMSNDIEALLMQLQSNKSASVLVYTGGSYHVVWMSCDYYLDGDDSIYISHCAYNFELSDIKSYCILEIE